MCIGVTLIFVIYMAGTQRRFRPLAATMSRSENCWGKTFIKIQRVLKMCLSVAVVTQTFVLERSRRLQPYLRLCFGLVLVKCKSSHHGSFCVALLSELMSRFASETYTYILLKIPTLLYTRF